MNCPHCGHPLPRSGLTDLQRRCADAILAHRAPNGTCLVSVTDVATRIGRNRGSTRNMIDRLVELGYFTVVYKGSPERGPSRYLPMPKLGEEGIRRANA